MNNILKQIKLLSTKFHKDSISIRRHLHSNPELSFKEYNTSKYIASIIKKLDLKIKEGIAKTGLEVIIEGKKSPSDKVIALRADIDALPIQEKNEVEYKSKNKGVMHACGHDVHTSSLIGVAKILKELQNEFSGKVKLIFQPGEEKLPGGASLMIKEGILKNPKPEVIFGQHVFPNLSVGTVGFCNKVCTASTDEIRLKIKGKGGHAAMSHTLINPIVVASNIIISLQQVISRFKPPLVPSVLSFGKIEGLGATNIVPDEVNIEGTFRAMNEEWRKTALDKIKNISENTAKKMGAICEVKITKGYPCLENNEEIVNRSIKYAEQFLGKKNVINFEPKLYGEDFAYYAQKIPACFYGLGIKNERRNIISMLHTSTFDIDEKALEIGMGLMSWLTINELEHNTK